MCCAGLSEAQKAIPRVGCMTMPVRELFEDITQLPEYYPTRAETEILERRGERICGADRPGRAVVEFGSGSRVRPLCCCARLIPPVMSRWTSPAISCALRRRACTASVPRPAVHAGGGVHAPGRPCPKSPTGPSEAGFLPRFDDRQLGGPHGGGPASIDARNLGEGAQLLIGMDLIKDGAVLIAAYDDAGARHGAVQLRPRPPDQPRTGR